MLALALTVLLAAAPEAPLDLARFSSDQGPLEGLTRWGGQVVALSRPLRVLDVAAGTSAVLAVPGLDEVIAVAGDTVRFAVGRRGTALVLRRERGAKWEDLDWHPAEKGSDPRWPVVLGAAGERCAVTWLELDERPDPPLARLRLATWDGKAWQHALLSWTAQQAPKWLRWAGGRWLLAYSRGEWGGSLWSFDATGRLTEVGPEDRLPVQGVVPLPDGSALVGRGLAHRGRRSTTVGVLQADGAWQTLTRTEASDRTRDVAWDLPPDALEGFDADAAGRPCLATREHGVLRWAGGRLEPLTPGWPQGLRVSTGGLIIDGPLALLGTVDRGVLAWTLGTRTVRRIPIPLP